MFNLRYHIASLVAVFLALAVGLLLGGVVVERGTLDRQRDSIVKSLQEDFAQLSSENKSLKAEGDRRAKFAQQYLPALLAGKLAGKTIVVLADPARRDVIGPVTDAIRAAGGTPVLVRMRVKDFGLQDSRFASSLPSLPAEDSTARTTALAAAMAAEWAAVGPRPITAGLRDSGAIDGDELPDGPIGGVVVAASWQDGDKAVATADSTALALADSLQRSGVPVVAAEGSSADIGCVSAATSRALSAVDDVDQPEGALSLVWVLAGKAEGYFGTRQGADAAFPKLEDS